MATTGQPRNCHVSAMVQHVLWLSLSPAVQCFHLPATQQGSSNFPLQAAAFCQPAGLKGEGLAMAEEGGAGSHLLGGWGGLSPSLQIVGSSSLFLPHWAGH